MVSQAVWIFRFLVFLSQFLTPSETLGGGKKKKKKKVNAQVRIQYLPQNIEGSLLLRTDHSNEAKGTRAACITQKLKTSKAVGITE